ncbi:predicted protein [Plenodomus lingam JN3]|uniref:Predicted protein n=1 Tax=Leptosphaeria maculans (strain JN3 / isolate v23.1.3 / race Av1-4-5-6-7-8) TaxID=985895 RepID=E4ZWG3_LEPMJ|nr:predicted protein [Plenodomus lingam JN3]CBX95939.1 predicted protein [Plenodomus lingam JN3]
MDSYALYQADNPGALTRSQKHDRHRSRAELTRSSRLGGWMNPAARDGIRGRHPGGSTYPILFARLAWEGGDCDNRSYNPLLFTGHDFKERSDATTAVPWPRFLPVNLGTLVVYSERTVGRAGSRSVHGWRLALPLPEEGQNESMSLAANSLLCLPRQSPWTYQQLP